MSVTNMRLEKKVEEVPWTLLQILFGILFTVVVGLMSVLFFKRLEVSDTLPLPPDRDLTNAIVTFACGMVLELVFLIAPFFYARLAVREAEVLSGEQSSKVRARSVLQMLGFRSFNWPNALFWLLLSFLAVCFVNFLYHLFIQTFHLSMLTIEQDVLAQGFSQPLTVYSTLIASIVFSPVCEEVFFRGFLLMGLARVMPAWLAIVISSFLFGVAHFESLSSLPVLFFVGLTLGFLRWHTRSIWPGILLQLLINSSASLLIVLAMNRIGV
jgi:membrane protease YdiL (CAAX protease family)